MNIPDEEINIEYLKKRKFEKYLLNLKNKLKDKSVIIYGAGALLQVILKYYVLDFNIIAISDLRFQEGNENFCGYSTCAPSQIKILKPDYVLVATKKYLPTALKLDTDTHTKILPLIKKSIKEIWKEIVEN